MSYYGSSQPSDKLTGLGLPGGQTKPRHQRADGGVRSTLYNSLVGNNRECSNSILPSVFFAGTHQSGSSRRDSAFARIIQRQHDRKNLMGEVLGQLVMRAQLTPKYSEQFGVLSYVVARHIIGNELTLLCHVEFPTQPQ